MDSLALRKTVINALVGCRQRDYFSGNLLISPSQARGERVDCAALKRYPAVELPCETSTRETGTPNPCDDVELEAAKQCAEIYVYGTVFGLYNGRDLADEA